MVSNKMTVKVTVIRVTLASMAPAPMSAYAPGSTSWLPGNMELPETTSPTSLGEGQGWEVGVRGGDGMKYQRW